MANIYTAADQLIGKTPLLELTHIEKEYGLKAKILAKLEYFNPAGSVKDRIAKGMIDDAEQKGRLKKGSVIIEPVSYTHRDVYKRQAETDVTVNLKIKAALAAGLKPILCVGEKLEERDSGATDIVLTVSYPHLWRWHMRE